VLEALSRGEEALRYYSIARALRPETAHELAHVLERKGESLDGIAVFRDLARLSPDHGPHWICYGRLIKERGDYSGSKEALGKAAAILRRRIQLKPEVAIAHNNLGKALHEQGKLDDAIATYREAIRLKPDYAEAHGNLGTALSEQGKQDTAIAALREAIRLKPDYAFGHFSLGNALHQKGKLADAIAAYREAVRFKPAAALVYNNLAWALVVSPKRPRCDYDEGLVHARKAVELTPNDMSHLNTLALAEYRSGHWAESLHASKRSMELGKGGDADDWFFQAMARWQSGAKDEAREWFDRAVARTKEKERENAELRQFWEEAAQLLGRPGPNPAGESPPAANR
jgi:tetratricopeptide (TPR) repeat protein